MGGGVKNNPDQLSVASVNLRTCVLVQFWEFLDHYFFKYRFNYLLLEILLEESCNYRIFFYLCLCNFLHSSHPFISLCCVLGKFLKVTLQLPHLSFSCV